MNSTVEIIHWRDIPAQVLARHGRVVHRVALSPRFQTAIDQAATRAGRTDADDYLAEWRKERADGSENPAEAARDEAARLEAAFSDAVLQQYVHNEGWAP